MKKTLLFLSVLFFLQSSFAQTLTDTIRTRLIARWQITAMATDENGNDKIDSSEVFNILPEDEVDLYLTFNSDGTGFLMMDIFGNKPDPIEWSIVSPSEVKIKTKKKRTRSFMIYKVSAAGSETMHIDELTDNVLVLSGIEDGKMTTIRCNRK